VLPGRRGGKRRERKKKCGEKGGKKGEGSPVAPYPIPAVHLLLSISPISFNGKKGGGGEKRKP